MFNVWKYEHKLSKINLTIKGHSRGSEKTGFFIPQLKLFLDAGLQSPFDPKYIFITHRHSDHCFALPMLLTHIQNKPNVYVPDSSLTVIRQFINSVKALDNSNEIGKKNKTCDDICNLKSAIPNTFIPVGKNYSMEVLELDHTVPAVGYILHMTRTKLKDEYQGLKGDELIALKKSNKEINTTVQTPQLAFICDTSISAFEMNKQILECPYVIVECTFYTDETLEMSREGKHIHWNDLKPIVLQNPDTEFILIHSSMRYKEDDILIPEHEKPKNVFLWTN